VAGVAIGISSRLELGVKRSGGKIAAPVPPQNGSKLLQVCASEGGETMPNASDVRKIALALDGVTQIDHFARPAWRTAKRIFAVMRPDGLYLNLPDERKEFLFEADPKTFVKYMWGKTANVIVQIDRVSKKELEALIREAWTHNLPPPKPARRKSAKKSAPKAAKKKRK
jgi:hypothetical protein